MCLLCIEFQKQRMTLEEARRAFREMVEGLDPAHVVEVEEMLTAAENNIGDRRNEASRKSDAIS